MKGNEFIALALQSPLHVLMGDTLLITLKGRKTGRAISLPVNYYREGNEIWIISSRDRKWWRNLVHGGEVTLHLHGRNAKGYAEAILDESAVAAEMGEYVRHLPGSARGLGLRVDHGVPNCEDVERLAKERLFVKICLVN